MTYEIRVHQTLTASTTGYDVIADADIISVDLGEQGNANADPFEIIGRKVSVSVYASSRTEFLQHLTVGLYGYENLISIINTTNNTPIFAGMIKPEGWRLDYSRNRYELEISDSLDMWITQAKQITLSAGYQGSLQELFMRPLASFEDLNNWIWDYTIDTPRLKTVQYYKGFPIVDYPYASVMVQSPEGANFSMLGDDLFADDEDPDNWRIVSRQVAIYSNRATFFTIIREYPFVPLNVHMRVVYYTIRLDSNKLIQILDNGKRGVIRPPQSNNQSAVHTYIKNELVNAGALAEDVTFSSGYVSEYQGLYDPSNPLINPGELVTSLVPVFDTDAQYTYPSGEWIRLNKYGTATGYINVAKTNLYTEETTLADVAKAFCTLLGIGLKARVEGGIKSFPHVLRNFSTATPISVSDADIIDMDLGGTFADIKRVLDSLTAFQKGKLIYGVMENEILRVYSLIRNTVRVVLPYSEYSAYDLSGFTPLTIKGKTYYATRWTVPLETPLFNLYAIGGLE